MSDIRLHGRMVNFSKLTFATGDLSRTEAALKELLGDSDKNSGLLVVVDCLERTDLSVLLRQVRAFGLQPFAVADGLLAEQAKVRNIPVLPADKSPQRIDAPHQKEG